MKKILLLVLVTFSSFLRAQTSIYHPFPDSNAYWNNIVEVFCFPMQNYVFDNYSITIGTDTIIQGTTYHTFQVPFIQSGSNGLCPFIPSGYKGAFRQDTSQRVVYIVAPGDSVEQILYDFTLEVGDTVQGYLERNAWSVETVVDIDSILVGSDYRKRWLINTDYQLYLTEGIGFHYGLLEASPGNILDATYINLTCFTQNGVTLYTTNFSTCDLIDELKETLNPSAVICRPNPATTVSRIELSQSFVHGQFKLFDLTGRLIDENFIDNENIEYDVSSLKNGIYFMSFISQDGKSAFCKVVKEHP